ncbi:UDP-N-acetylhexosamine pyrophosphorylase-like protein 1 [Lethenteron reissneri]|uniref:UDP-N-acetylhexosamine pyrophosphorylase-like protein 1 n=1 Tax=Lethenteron reissneri TaxID=7753 RepID=UPI002AB6AC67|nr:UDP-N-acetylhexosamine pyrophosphorylase-like protein 1 [Lethenteron reissneri]
MSANVDEQRARYEAAGQGHVFRFWEQLSQGQRDTLLSQLKDIDPEEVGRSYRAMQRGQGESEAPEDVKPVPEDAFGSMSRSPASLLSQWEKQGLEQIAEGRMAVLLLAGGQGTRLGMSCPKGMVSVGLPSGKSLFQLQAERIRALQRLAGTAKPVPWYIVTSAHTHAPTEAFFREHAWFGLDPDSVRFFQQGQLPALTISGKIILQDKGLIAMAPNGNGGVYRALSSSGALADMQARGVRHVHAYCVDNVLVRVGDPVFLGFCIHKNADCGAEVVEKVDPTEPVGVVCRVGDHYRVLEYSEISSELASRRGTHGRLEFSAASICNHYFSVDFLQEVVRQYEPQMLYHVAHKKVGYVDDEGRPVAPDKPNGIKMEKFIFDVFPFSKNFAVFEVLREDAFSPLKNADKPGQVDCPSTARKAVYSLHAHWVEKAGGHVSSGSGGVVCEISPLVSYAGEALQERVKGKTFPSPFVLD